MRSSPAEPRSGARAVAISWLKMNCSPTLIPAPPYSFGHGGAPADDHRVAVRRAAFLPHPVLVGGRAELRRQVGGHEAPHLAPELCLLRTVAKLHRAPLSPTCRR